MLEIISTIAAVTSTFIDLLGALDNSNNQKTRRKPQKETRNTHETKQMITSKVNAFLSEFTRHKNNIGNGLGISIFVWIMGSFFILVWSSSLSLRHPIFMWITGIIVWLLFTILVYSILFGTIQFLIKRKLDYYSFQKDSFFYLTLKLEKIYWSNVVIKLFVEQVFIEIKRHNKW